MAAEESIKGNICNGSHWNEDDSNNLHAQQNEDCWRDEEKMDDEEFIEKNTFDVIGSTKIFLQNNQSNNNIVENDKNPARIHPRYKYFATMLICFVILGSVVGIILWRINKVYNGIIPGKKNTHSTSNITAAVSSENTLHPSQDTNNIFLSDPFDKNTSSTNHEPSIAPVLEGDDGKAVAQQEQQDDISGTTTSPFLDATDDPNNNHQSQYFDFSPFLVGAYYYPWHKHNFHNHEGYLRKELEPLQQPYLGEYDDSQPSIISQHLSWSLQANIGLWVASWWGPNHVTDQTTRDVIMEHHEIGNMKIALHYETSGRLGRNNYDLSIAESDIEYICDRYFSHPAYYRIHDPDGNNNNNNGRPILFLYLARALDRLDLLSSVILTMKRAASRKCGQDLFVVGDHVFSNSPDNPSSVYDSFMYLDAVTSYDVYGSMGRPSGYAGHETVNKYHSEQRNWRRVAHLSGCQYIPAVSPGFNDRGVRLDADHPALSRRITADAEEGSLFGYQITLAKQIVDPNMGNLIMVNSFNEWHEDTQIEPVVGDASSTPINLTEGLEYVGYNDLYLNILRMGTIERRNIFDQFNYGDRR